MSIDPKKQAFFAYSNKPDDISESIENCITQINKGEDLNIIGWRT